MATSPDQHMPTGDDSGKGWNGLPEPPKEAYESVPRRFTWRSSLFMALVLWLVLMIVVAECTVARNAQAADGEIGSHAGRSGAEKSETK